MPRGVQAAYPGRQVVAFTGDGSLTMQLGDFLTLASALRDGTPNRRRIALQMTKDMLDESSFEASPAHAVPGPIGKAGAKITDKLRRHAED